MLKAGREYGQKLGYRMEVFEMTDFKDGAQASRVLFSRGIQGVILPHFFRPELLPGMDWKRFLGRGPGRGTG